METNPEARGIVYGVAISVVCFWVPLAIAWRYAPRIILGSIKW